MKMLDLYIENKDSFKVKKKLWEAIAKKMREDYNIKVTAANVECRFKNLNASFKLKINPSDPKNNSGGEAASSWAYMDIMMDINDKKRQCFQQN